jgi:SpoVT / AbrB like domain.
MKSGSVVRVIDELGRIVIPVDIRRKLDITLRESVEIYIEGDRIIIERLGENTAAKAKKEPRGKPEYARVRIVRRADRK